MPAYILERRSERDGLEVNPIFRDIQGIENLRSIPKAVLNIVISPWLGLEATRKLEEKFGAPFPWSRTGCPWDPGILRPF